MDIEKIRKEKPMSELLRFSIINIDKPSGPTSFTVSNFIKHELKVNKTSHFGTLDPIVTGVLPVALGRACRLNEYFMHRNKTYVGIMRLHDKIDDKKVNEAIAAFIGKITQLPPVRSRVKRAERVREIKSFEIIERDGNDVVFKSEVQAGTYIRKLIHDVGLQIGGAHMLELRRTAAGMFFEDTCVTIYEFEKALEAYHAGDEGPLRKILVPAEVVTTLLPTVEVEAQVVKKCLTGSPVFPTFLKNPKQLEGLSKDDKLCVVSGEQFVGCYRYVGAETIVAVPEFVFNSA